MKCNRSCFSTIKCDVIRWSCKLDLDASLILKYHVGKRLFKGDKLYNLVGVSRAQIVQKLSFVNVRFFFWQWGFTARFQFGASQLNWPHLCLANAKSSAGLLEMPDIRSAMEALTLTNHFTINPPGNERTCFFLLLSHS